MAAVELERTPNMPFLIGLGFNIWANCWQAGFSQAGNNIVGDYLKIQLEWSDKEAEFNNSIIGFVEPLGITAGSLAAGVFL